MTTITDVYTDYAKAIGAGVETLTDAQKKQAFLNAILEGQRVEPFATFCDWGQAALDSVTSERIKTLATLLQEKQQ